MTRASHAQPACRTRQAIRQQPRTRRPAAKTAGRDPGKHLGKHRRLFCAPATEPVERRTAETPSRPDQEALPDAPE